MDAEKFFAGTRAFCKDGEPNEFYFYGDKNMVIVPAGREGFKNQVSFKAIVKTEDGLKARELVVSMYCGKTITDAFAKTDWRGWIRCTKQKTPKGQVGWTAQRFDADPVDTDTINALVVDLDAMIVARSGAENVGENDEDIPF